MVPYNYAGARRRKRNFREDLKIAFLGYRVTSAKCMSMVELWRKVQQCHLVTLREAFTTKAFGDHSIVFAYDYYPGAETLLSKYLASTAPHLDPFSSDPSAPRPYTMQKNRMLQQQAGKGLLSNTFLFFNCHCRENVS